MKPLVIILALAVTAPGAARDREFDAIVRALEARYDSSPTHIPMFGFANFLVKVARPSGATDLKLAIFADLRQPVFREEEDFTALVGESLGPDWHPFIRVHERRHDQWVCIYSNFAAGRWKLLIASLEQREAAVIRIRLNPGGMRNWVLCPAHRARRYAGD